MLFSMQASFQFISMKYFIRFTNYEEMLFVTEISMNFKNSFFATFFFENLKFSLFCGFDLKIVLMKYIFGQLILIFLNKRQKALFYI